MEAYIYEDQARKACKLRISEAHGTPGGCFYCNVSFKPLIDEEEQVFADSDEKAIALSFKFLRLLAFGLHVEDEHGNPVTIQAADGRYM
ncbi:hypothetical protein [Dyella sp.]|uniref:hypothetical protein n=1 Tax=Dyella sp. TaxID=1869338 RepID=UPI002ED04B86